MRDSKQEIVHFWFDETEPTLWFQNNPAFDALVGERFSLIYDMAADGLCNAWASDAEGALALCLVLDQFPRRMFRGSPRAFGTDEKALLIAKQAISRGFDQLFTHEKRFFLYMPFEHSERLSDQKRNLELFKSIERDNPLACAVAKRRYDIIEKFGRFPERNEALGRESTPEETDYLNKLT
ncbi:MAG: DUF924 family protein [Alphaproteobacteria bacterium]